MVSPVVWIVDADHWPRAYLRAELIERGYDAIGFVTLQEAVVRLLLPGSRQPSLLVVALRAQGLDDRLSGVLMRERIPIVAVVDAASSPPRELSPAVNVLRRPLTIGAIADTVDHLIDHVRTTGMP